MFLKLNWTLKDYILRVWESQNKPSFKNTELRRWWRRGRGREDPDIKFCHKVIFRQIYCPNLYYLYVPKLQAASGSGLVKHLCAKQKQIQIHFVETPLSWPRKNILKYISSAASSTWLKITKHTKKQVILNKNY